MNSAFRIDAALVGDRASHGQTVRAVQAAARDSLVFHRYPSAAALQAIDRQQEYALDLTPTRPRLYVASAAGASGARVLERVSAVDPIFTSSVAAPRVMSRH